MSGPNQEPAVEMSVAVSADFSTSAGTSMHARLINGCLSTILVPFPPIPPDPAVFIIASPSSDNGVSGSLPAAINDKLKTPDWLKACDAYIAYVTEGLKDSELPNYQENENGEVIIQKGECFCRIEGCPRRSQHHLFPTLQSLRAHLNTFHRMKVQRLQAGCVSIKRREEIKQWYRATMFPNGLPQESDSDTNSIESRKVARV